MTVFKISPPTTLSQVAPQIYYVGSHLGNSQLVKLLQAPDSASETDTLPIPSGIPTSLPSVLGTEKGKELPMDDEKERAKGTIVRLKGSYLETLEPFRNIAPIVDAILADVDGSGQVKSPVHKHTLLKLIPLVAPTDHLFR